MFLQVQRWCFHCCYSWVCRVYYILLSQTTEKVKLSHAIEMMCRMLHIEIRIFVFLGILFLLDEDSWLRGEKTDPYTNTTWMQHLKMATVLVMQVDLNKHRPCSKVWYCYFSSSWNYKFSSICHFTECTCAVKVDTSEAG